MTSYAGRHAELYDLFYADKDYAGEARFVHECLARRASGPTRRVLDLACGTGRHALELEALGHEVLGVDHSEPMLAVARARAARAGASARFQVGDLRSLAIEGSPFDAAVCLFDSIGYVVTNEALERALRGIRGALRPGGLFVLEFWHAAAMLRSHDPVRVRRWESAGGGVVRISETTLDAARQLARVTYSVYEHSPGGTISSFTEVQTNRYFLVQEMAHWLACCGFRPLAWHDGFTPDERVTERTWHVVGVAQAGGEGP